MCSRTLGSGYLISVVSRVAACHILCMLTCAVLMTSSHSEGRGAGSIGAGGASVNMAAGGSVVVDTMLGLRLHHSPVTGSDEIALAVSAASKAYKLAINFGGNSQKETRQERLQRMRSSGLRVFATVPDVYDAYVWPTAVGFSLTTKQWGHVVIDELRAILPKNDAWRELVLPAGVKEMLLATSAAALRSTIGNVSIRNTGVEEGAAPASSSPATVGAGAGAAMAASPPDLAAVHRLAMEPRYRTQDVVGNKGEGSLFLLYGPPGTGKTLSVQALAELFGRPLYTISFAELGSSVAELEERLTDVLTLASAWGYVCCVLLFWNAEDIVGGRTVMAAASKRSFHVVSQSPSHWGTACLSTS